MAAKKKKNGFLFVRALSILYAYPQNRVLLVLHILVQVTMSTARHRTKEDYTHWQLIKEMENASG